MTDTSSPETVNQPQPSQLVAVHAGLSATQADPGLTPSEALRAEVDAEPAPAPPPAAATSMPPGWYRDPAAPMTQRYWAGDHWVGDPLPADVTPPDKPPLDLPDGAIAVPIAGHIVHVIPRTEWRKSAINALRQGDFDTWAERCLATDDDLDLWDQLDPTTGQIEEMFTTYGELTGMPAGKAQTSRRSRRGGRGR